MQRNEFVLDRATGAVVRQFVRETGHTPEEVIGCAINLLTSTLQRLEVDGKAPTDPFTARPDEFLETLVRAALERHGVKLDIPPGFRA